MRLGNLQTLEDVQKLRAALHAKAKEEPAFRFYALYDKIYRRDVLLEAYKCCKANGGAAGVDGVTFKDIKEYGEEKWLGELAERLRKKDYKPEAVRRVWISKPGSKKMRPLGIPTIIDRTVQTATMSILEPIFEADLQPEQFAYREQRGTHDAIRAVHQLLSSGHRHTVDADLSGYFDSIPHYELLTCVARRVSDKHVMHLIKMWLDAPVEEDDGHGHRKRTTPNRDAGRGTPQGSPISPLLSNIYMRRFLLGWKQLGYDRRWKAHIVNYADDFVICCKGRADEAMEAMRRIMTKLKLTVNEEKTHVCHLPQERFTFCGYTFGRYYSPRTGGAYIGARPSEKSCRRMMANISQVTDRCRTPLEVEEIVGNLNLKLTGWANQFCLGTVKQAYKAIDTHTARRLRRWLCKKYKVRGSGRTRFTDQFLYDELGLERISDRKYNHPWAKA
jgi:group II intron reverse transcriptase/maturase